MYANRQRTHLSTFEDRVDIFMRQFEVLARRDLELNQADVVVAGDNTRPVPDASTRSMRVEP